MIIIVNDYYWGDVCKHACHLRASMLPTYLKMDVLYSNPLVSLFTVRRDVTQWCTHMYEMHTCIYMYEMHTCIYMYEMHTCMRCTHIYTYAYTYAHMYEMHTCMRCTHVWDAHICTHVWDALTYTYAYTHAHTNTHAYTYALTCTHAYTHAHTYTHAYTYAHTGIHNSVWDTPLHTCACNNTHMRQHTRIRTPQTYTYAHAITRTCAQSPTNLQMCACNNTNTQTHTHLPTNLHICACNNTQIRKHTRIRTPHTTVKGSAPHKQSQRIHNPCTPSNKHTCTSNAHIETHT